MKVKTRTIQPTHANDVYNIERVSYPHEFMTEKNIEKVIKRLNSDGFVVLDHVDRVLGYVLYDNNDDNIEIVRLAVHQFHRKCGYGKRLLDMVKAKLTTNKDRLVIHVPDYLLEGQIFLRTQGCIASKVDYHHYRKHLTDSFQFTFLKDWLEIDGSTVIAEDEVVASSGV